MSRRGRQGVAISLFAFQDIITSVSGILIVTVLLMTLDLLQQPEAAQSQQPLRATVAAAEEAIAEATRERDRLQQSLSVVADNVNETAAAVPAVVQQETVAIEHEQQRLRSELADLKARRAEARLRESTAEARQFDSRAQRKRLEELQQQTKAAQAQAAEDRQQDRVFYETPRGFDKQGWVVVVGGNKIAVASLKTAGPPQTFTGTGISAGPIADTKLVESFWNWLEPEATARTYLLILVRPSGVANFKTLRSKVEDTSVTYGFDTVGEHQKVLDPARGAVP